MGRTRTLKGLAVSPGVAIGRAVVVLYDITVPDFHIPESDVRLELLKFDAALALCKEQLLQIREHEIDDDDTVQDILESQLLILVDPLFVGEVVNRVKKELRNVEKVVSDVVTEFSRMFDSMSDTYLRDRASDIRDIGGRILRNLLGEDPPPLHLLDKETILVCDHLNVSEVAHLDPERVLGLVSEIGGETSHPAILARSLGIPSIVSVLEATKVVKTGDQLIVDCINGLVLVNPTRDEFASYKKIREELESSWERLLEDSQEPVSTHEGVEITFLANISVPNEIDQVLRFGASGVGLFRSEYLYMNKSSFPSEEDQAQAYLRVARGALPGPVTIRTLDIGGDKELPYLCFIKESNPFLGWRSIRFSLDNVDIFKTQLRALLRASVTGNLRVMFPMISCMEELWRAKELLDEVRLELRREGIAFDENMKVGMMIEVPSAAILSEALAREVDFFSIGTNDLTQFTLAVDRTNQKLSDLFDSLSPAVLKMIHMTVKAAGLAGINVSCCGEMTATPMGFLVLLGLGVREFSCNLFSVPQMRRLGNDIELSLVEELAEQALNARTADEVRGIFSAAERKVLESMGEMQGLIPSLG